MSFLKGAWPTAEVAAPPFCRSVTSPTKAGSGRARARVEEAPNQAFMKKMALFCICLLRSFVQAGYSTNKKICVIGRAQLQVSAAQCTAKSDVASHSVSPRTGQAMAVAEVGTPVPPL